MPAHGRVSPKNISSNTSTLQSQVIGFENWPKRKSVCDAGRSQRCEGLTVNIRTNLPFILLFVDVDIFQWKIRIVAVLTFQVTGKSSMVKKKGRVQKKNRKVGIGQRYINASHFFLIFCFYFLHFNWVNLHFCFLSLVFLLHALFYITPGLNPLVGSASLRTNSSVN